MREVYSDRPLMLQQNLNLSLWILGFRWRRIGVVRLDPIPLIECFLRFFQRLHRKIGRLAVMGS